MAFSSASVALRPDVFGVPPDGPITLSDAAGTLLYEDIVSGRLPPGLKLKPDELKLRYGVGTSPIREALLRLSADGLVERSGQRGFRVPSVSRAELADIADVRCRLSGWALRLSIDRGDAAWEARVVGAFHRLDKMTTLLAADPVLHLDEWERLNRQFHQALETGCGSPWLLRFAGLAYSQSERYRRHFVDYPALMPESQEEHRLILDAALRRDADAACLLLERHILKGVAVVRQGMPPGEEPSTRNRP